MQSIGERLEEARKRKGISIREASEATKIRGDYLHKFESNQFDIKLPEIYVRGFIRTYANYLKLPADKIINDYNGLGLADTKSTRGLNREVYGRLDLSVSTAKSEKAGKEASPTSEQQTQPETNPPVEAGPRNPATFVPRGDGPSGMPIDKRLLITLSVIVGATAALVLLVIWLMFGRGSSPKAAPAAVAAVASSDIVWIRPQAGEAVLTLVAAEHVQATVTQTDGTILYQGAMPRGDRREIPRRGKLSVRTDSPENLKIEIAGHAYDMPKGANGAYLKSADIQAP